MRRSSTGLLDAPNAVRAVFAHPGEDEPDEWVVDGLCGRLHRHVDGRTDAVDRFVLCQLRPQSAVPVDFDLHMPAPAATSPSPPPILPVGRLLDVVRRPRVEAVGKPTSEPFRHVLDDENAEVRVRR